MYKVFRMIIISIMLCFVLFVGNVNSCPSMPQITAKTKPIVNEPVDLNRSPNTSFMEITDWRVKIKGESKFKDKAVQVVFPEAGENQIDIQIEWRFRDTIKDPWQEGKVINTEIPVKVFADIMQRGGSNGNNQVVPKGATNAELIEEQVIDYWADKYIGINSEVAFAPSPALKNIDNSLDENGVVSAELSTSIPGKYDISIKGTYVNKFEFVETVFEVNIGDVVRAEGLPNSVSPGKTATVFISINPSFTIPGHNISLDVINCNVSNGIAAISGNAILTNSGKITIIGVGQTSPGSAGQIKIRARLDGVTQCAISNGFSICAHLNNFEVKEFTPQGSTLIVDYSWKSDSGNLKDLDAGRVVEIVTYDSSANPYFPQSPPFSGWYPNPSSDNPSQGQNGGLSDSHSSSFIAPYAAASFIAHQTYVWKCDRCSCSQNILNSNIVRKVEYIDQFQAWKFTVTKGVPSSQYWLP